MREIIIFYFYVTCADFCDNLLDSPVMEEHYYLYLDWSFWLVFDRARSTFIIYL